MRKIILIALAVLAVGTAADAGVRYATKRWVKKQIAQVENRLATSAPQVTYVSETEDVPAPSVSANTVFCPAGTRAIGAGWGGSPIDAFRTVASFPGQEGGSWTVRVEVSDWDGPEYWTVTAVCLRV